MSQQFRIEELIDKILLIETLNATLIHFMLSSEVEGSIDPDRVDALIQGLTKTRVWLEESANEERVPQSIGNILSLLAKRLAQLESLLPKLSRRAKEIERAGTAQEIISLLDGIPPVTDMRTRSSPTPATPPQQVGSPGIPQNDTTEVMQRVAEQPTLSPSSTMATRVTPTQTFRRVDIEDDQFGLVGQNRYLIEQYSKRCHVLLPIFWFEVMREIHRYRSQSSAMGDVVEIPSQIITKIVKTLLTEAPGARLLQDLLKHREQEDTLQPSEIERVERAVAKYFHGVEDVLRGQLSNVSEKIVEAQNAIDGFGWGGPELEKRLIKRIHQHCQEALQSAESVTDDMRKIIYAETTKLLCKVQHAILAEPRLQAILAEMKP